MKFLERSLGLNSVLAVSIGAMLGSGLFVLPGLAVVTTGPSLWLAYLTAAICVLPAALSKSELATAMPVSGGTYVYIDRTFGPLFGTIMGVGLWLSLLLKSAFALAGFGAYLLVVVEDINVKTVSLMLLGAVTAINMIGVRKVGKIQTWVVGAALICLLALALWGLPTIHLEHFRESFSGGLTGFLTTVSFVYIAYAGVTKVAAVAEEVSDPGRNLPLGMLLSLLIVAGVYGLVTFVMVGHVPAQDLSGDLKPIHSMAMAIGGPLLGGAAAVLGVMTMTSMANAGLLASSRFPFAMSRDRLLPSGLSRVNRRFLTPVWAIIITALLMGAAITWLDIAKIAKLASSLKITAFCLVNIAVIVLRESNAQWYKPRFHSPLYPWVQIFGIAMAVVLLLVMGPIGIAALLGMTVPGALVYFLYGRRFSERSGVFGRLSVRRDLLATRLSQAQERLEEAQNQAEPAGVVVPLFGGENSSPRLVRLAHSLADGRSVMVTHLTDVPEQTMLDALADDESDVEALRTQVQNLAKEENLAVDFEAVVTHDIAKTALDISERFFCDWMVMEWRSSTERGMTFFNPLGWLTDHLSCNLALYKDAGNDSVERVMVYATPGPHDALVVQVAARLAQSHGLSVTLVGFVPATASASAMASQEGYLKQLAALSNAKADYRIVRGGDEIRAVAKATNDFDLLIMGSQKQGTFSRYFFKSNAHRLLEQAKCSVLKLRTPRQLTHQALSHDVMATVKTPTNLTDFVQRRCVRTRLKLTRKEALFGYIAHTFAKNLHGVSAKAIEEALWKRESEQNTAVGYGMALPHATIENAEKTMMGIFIAAAPMDYRSPDGAPADLFFATLGPPSDRNAHLVMLSEISRLSHTPGVLEALRGAQSADEVLAVLSKPAGEETTRESQESA